jgi:hypothetical protein
MTMDVTRLNSAAVQTSQLRSQSKPTTLPASERAEEKREAAPSPTKIKFTRAEKEYFADAFPGAAKDIRQHVLYRKDGVQRSSPLGTVVDRRG